ncbi:hypothetical protein STEG23_008658, partial [Scotinomys teguina]
VKVDGDEILYVITEQNSARRHEIATWPMACDSTLFHYMVTSSMAGWRLLPASSLWATSSSFPCPTFLAITKSEPFIDID